MLVYSEAKSPRLAYVTDFLSRELFDGPVTVTTDPDVFTACEGPKLQYGGVRLKTAVFYLPAVSILFEQGLRPQPLEFFFTGNVPAFFSGAGDLPFDVFAGIFFLLSRYEEWLPHSTDAYGRFPPESSVAFRNGFLQRPLIDEWLCLFQSTLITVFPGLRFRSRSFRFLPTYDIDMAWSYLGKGFLRNAGGTVRDLLKRDLAGLRERQATLSGKVKDPFDSFHWLDELHMKYRLRPRYFFLLAGKPGRLDKNISPADASMRQLVKDHTFRYDTGIHPSWQSGNNRPLLEREVETLSGLSGTAVSASRQHYLRFTMPVTFRQLIDAGIRNDFSMGYGAANGFRASFSGSFFWYDLEKDQQSELLLTPFCFMDAAAFYGQGLDAEAALSELRSLAERVARVSGQLTTLWHNHFLGTAPAYNGWRSAYETFVAEFAGF